MSSLIECDSCGASLRDNIQGDLYCPNEECTGVFSIKEYVREDKVVSNIDPEQPELDEPYNKREDAVNEPNHYKLFGMVEVIDMIKTLLTEEEFRGYLKGNCLKYRLRAGKKDNVGQDIAKAMRYEQWLQQ